MHIGQEKSRVLSSLVWLSAGAAAGAAVMYLFDPKLGHGRRNYIKQKGTSLGNQAGKQASRTVRHWTNRGKGLVAKVSKALGVGPELPSSSDDGDSQLSFSRRSEGAEKAAYLH